MADIIIRKAKKDYVCDVCGHIIRAGEEYLDKVITHDGKAVRHERYHDECPYADNAAIDKFIRKFIKSTNMIAENTYTHDKFHVTSINNGIMELSVGLLDWEWNKVPDVLISKFLKEYNYE